VRTRNRPSTVARRGRVYVQHGDGWLHAMKCLSRARVIMHWPHAHSRQSQPAHRCHGICGARDRFHSELRRSKSNYSRYASISHKYYRDVSYVYKPNFLKGKAVLGGHVSKRKPKNSWPRLTHQKCCQNVQCIIVWAMKKMKPESQFDWMELVRCNIVWRIYMLSKICIKLLRQISLWKLCKFKKSM